MHNLAYNKELTNMNGMKLFNQKMAQLLFFIFQLILSAPNKLLGHIKKITRYAIINILFVSAAVAQTSGGLPPRILELVPKDAILSSQNFTASQTLSEANFSAEKSVGEGRSVNFSLVIRAFDNSSPTWKMRVSAYRRQMEAHIENHRASLAPESANQDMWTADPVKETKNPWGTGLTQRLLNHPQLASKLTILNISE